MSKRPHIPNDVALAIRQRCGFGCVICGSPIFDYDHILGIKVSGDNPDFMTLLCPKHHREKTAGRLSEEDVLAENADPHNGDRQFTDHHDLYFARKKAVTLELGDLRMVTKPGTVQSCGVIVDGAVAIGARIADGHLRLDLNLRDLRNRPLLVVRDGAVRFATSNWDVTFKGKTIKIRKGKGKVVLEMVVNAKTSTITVKTADFALNHVRVQIGRSAKGRGLWLPDSSNIMTGVELAGGSVLIGTGRAGFGGFAFSGWPRAYHSLPVPVGAFRADKAVPPWGIRDIRSAARIRQYGWPEQWPFTIAAEWPTHRTVSADTGVDIDNPVHVLKVTKCGD